MPEPHGLGTEQVRFDPAQSQGVVGTHRALGYEDRLWHRLLGMCSGTFHTPHRHKYPHRPSWQNSESRASTLTAATEINDFNKIK